MALELGLDMILFTGCISQNKIKTTLGKHPKEHFKSLKESQHIVLLLWKLGLQTGRLANQPFVFLKTESGCAPSSTCELLAQNRKTQWSKKSNPCPDGCRRVSKGPTTTPRYLLPPHGTAAPASFRLGVPFLQWVPDFYVTGARGVFPVENNGNSPCTGGLAPYTTPALTASLSKVTQGWRVTR